MLLLLLASDIGAAGAICWCCVIVADCFYGLFSHFFYGIRNEIARMMMKFPRSLFIRRHAQKPNQTVSVTVKSEKSTGFMAFDVKTSVTIQVNAESILRFPFTPKCL